MCHHARKLHTECGIQLCRNKIVHIEKQYASNYLDGGGETAFGGGGPIGGGDDEVVESLFFAVQEVLGEDGAVLGDLEVVLVVTRSDGVGYFAVVA